MEKLEYMAMSHNKGLKVKTINGDVFDLVGVVNNDVYVEHPSYGDVWYNSFDVLPILRPLSDITKEIEHNGEKFVPIYNIKSLFVEAAEDLMNQSIDAIEYFLENNFFSRMEYLPFILIQKLIEWHFDIAGLIEKSEAIDVNSLPENPYK